MTASHRVNSQVSPDSGCFILKNQVPDLVFFWKSSRAQEKRDAQALNRPLKVRVRRWSQVAASGQLQTPLKVGC